MGLVGVKCCPVLFGVEVRAGILLNGTLIYNFPNPSGGKSACTFLGHPMTVEFGKGFDASNLKRMRSFYRAFPKGATSWHPLSWSHFKLLVSVKNETARDYYAKESAYTFFQEFLGLKNILFVVDAVR